MKNYKLLMVSVLAAITLSSCTQIVTNLDYEQCKRISFNNLEILRNCNNIREESLNTDKDFNISHKNLFIYINNMNENSDINKMCIKTLKNYNSQIIECINNKIYNNRKYQ